ncbi:MAG TPA: hypothetical protein VM096_19220 [Vicinamibacterales bacterium]|nr:hypothetical protein [Vicinamibacterales bacterium]
MIISFRALVISSLLLIGFVAVPDSYAQTVAADREIVHLTGRLYRVRVGDQHTVFLATPGGILLVDPLSADTAKWLATEFQKQFDDGDVKYVVYTNHNFDRAEGASIFIGSAQLIGQREFNGQLTIARRDGASSIVVSDRARARDRDGDGRVTAQELYSRVRDAGSLFDDERVIVIGGSTIELAHAPTTLASDNAIVNFPEARTAFASDAPPLDDVPFTFGEWKPIEMQRWLSAVAALDFDTLMLGDGRSIPKSRVELLSSYVNALLARVVSEYESGRSAGSFTDAKLLPAYRSNALFRDWQRNVGDIYESLSIVRVDATIGGFGHYAIRDTSYCASFTSCSTGGLVGAATGSVSVGNERWAALGEFLVTDNSFTAHTTRFVDEEFALVETRTSFLARHTRSAGAVSLRVLGGMSRTIGDRRGANRVKEGVLPFAGRHPIKSRDSRWGYTGGLDLVVGRRVGLVLPLRFTYAVSDGGAPTFPHRMDAQAGVALSLRVFRWIDY